MYALKIYKADILAELYIMTTSYIYNYNIIMSVHLLTITTDCCVTAWV